ncbi:cytochrome c5 family protein [Alcanivorax profundi]|uniref:Cytochrome c5 family protein n=1 Tax=Alcanivorax profundi TaxID=2338368 RepID=A0A418Y0I7_9GAMM|nr:MULTISPECIES: cytochrome c5 family protein [Alcanivorax]RJG18792.1 cytochrome c5 family protein [Alcanivorax profundi]|tara:strand:- start:407 stop:865 length:459 start_codon:yes stop_codon:yes gene_type:complete
MLTASLVLVAALFAAGNVAAKSTKEISPYPLGERSVFSDRATAERIKPVGSVCVEGEECGTAAAAGEEVASGPRSGEEVYNASCGACHASGAAGAPKTGDAGAWAPRIAQGEATLVKHAIEGLNAMPPKGMCMTCSDDEIKAAVEYMVEKSK